MLVLKNYLSSMAHEDSVDTVLVIQELRNQPRYGSAKESESNGHEFLSHCDSEHPVSMKRRGTMEVEMNRIPETMHSPPAPPATVTTRGEGAVQWKQLHNGNESGVEKQVFEKPSNYHTIKVYLATTS